MTSLPQWQAVAAAGNRPPHRLFKLSLWKLVDMDPLRLLYCINSAKYYYQLSI